MSLHMIALHGSGMNAQIWGGVAPHLTAAGHGAAFQPLNLPGHRAGEDESALLHSVPDMADWLMGQIDAVPAGREIVLIGHSMGAALSFYAAKHARVAGVIAVASAQRMPVNAELLALAESDPAAAQALVVKWGCDAKHPQIDAVRHVVSQIMQKTPAAAIGYDFRACNTMGEVPRHGKKALVVSGRFDKMTPVEQGKALAEAQGAQHMVLDSGHMIPCEHAPELAQAMVAFLDTL